MKAKQSKLIEKIEKLKREKKAILFAHNYQRPEIQDIADRVGDSIELSRMAVEEKEAKIIVFSAVNFMAESAAILNPDKKVLLPSQTARCPMAQMLPRDSVRIFKSKHPETPVVLYVNTLAEAKAECHVCCTSANAVKIVESLDSDVVLFGPDHNLAWYVQQKTDKKIISIPERGFCPTHILITEGDILLSKEKNPKAVFAVHPECIPQVQSLADFVGSTSQICRFSRESSAKEIVIGTENGILHRLKKENPNKVFIPAYEGTHCPNMKLNTLERIYLSLKEEIFPVTVTRPVANKAFKALKRMLEMTYDR